MLVLRRLGWYWLIALAVFFAMMIGGDVRGWFALAVVLCAAGAYVVALRRLRRRAAPTDTPAQVSKAGAFSEAELDRYARHIVLREVGGMGQRKLKDARVLVVGAGGLGSPVLLYLAAAGVGTIGVIDDDTVSNFEPAAADHPCRCADRDAQGVLGGNRDEGAEPLCDGAALQPPSDGGRSRMRCSRTMT